MNDAARTLHGNSSWRNLSRRWNMAFPPSMHGLSKWSLKLHESTLSSRPHPPGPQVALAFGTTSCRGCWDWPLVLAGGCAAGPLVSTSAVLWGSPHWSSSLPLHSSLVSPSFLWTCWPGGFTQDSGALSIRDTTCKQCAGFLGSPACLASTIPFSWKLLKSSS